MVKEKRGDRKPSGSFFSVETLGCIQRSLGSQHRVISTEDGDEKVYYSPSIGSGPDVGRSPRIVDISVFARPLPLGASPRDQYF